MEAMTPLIPNDAKNSAFPVAQFAFTVKNAGRCLPSQPNAPSRARIRTHHLVVPNALRWTSPGACWWCMACSVNVYSSYGGLRSAY